MKVRKGCRTVSQRYIDFLAKLAIDNAHPGGHRLTESIIRQSKIQAGDRVLDVGCGTGATAAFLTEEISAAVTAIDLHPKMVEHARQRADHSETHFQVLNASAEALPFKADAFDWLISESVTAFTDPDKSLPEYYRVLSPEGQLIAIEMTIEHPLPEEDKKAICGLYGVPALYTEQDWRDRLADAGFASIKCLREAELPEVQSKETGMPVYPLNAALDADAIEVWLDHLNMMQTYKDVLTYRIYWAIK